MTNYPNVLADLEELIKERDNLLVENYSLKQKLSAYEQGPTPPPPLPPDEPPAPHNDPPAAPSSTAEPTAMAQSPAMALLDEIARKASINSSQVPVDIEKLRAYLKGED
jgi:hypothetical protein